MYLSRVEIDVDNRRMMRQLTHLGAYHSWVEESFPNEIDQEVRTRKLWRIDDLDGKRYLLVLSETAPDLMSLEKFGVKSTAQTKSYDHFLSSLEEGMTLNFRVTLNPVISLSQGTGKRGTVVPHVTEEHQLQYLYDRALKNGFDLQHVKIIDRSFPRLKGKGKKALKIVKVTFEGVLTIADLEVFRNTLVRGIGKKKAYGMGLLTVIGRR